MAKYIYDSVLKSCYTQLRTYHPLTDINLKKDDFCIKIEFKLPKEWFGAPIWPP